MKAKIIQHLSDYKSTKEWDKMVFDKIIDKNMDTAHKERHLSHQLSLEIKDISECIEYVNTNY